MITCVFGLPGSGKSTLMAKMARDAMKKGRKVYCNFFLAGAYHIDFKDLGVYNFEDCLILIDEAMNEADSRGFKSFTPELKYFFSNHRHYHCDVVYFTQAYDDVDKRIRNNTARLLYCKKLLWWSTTTEIYRTITINDFSSEIVSGYKMGGLLSTRIYFRPRYYKYFDSFERKQLTPLQETHLVQYVLPERTKKGKVRFVRKMTNPFSFFFRQLRKH